MGMDRSDYKYVKDDEYMEKIVKDIDDRFVKYKLQTWQESQIRNIVKFYKKLRNAYNSVK